jgi:hypothetical protein
MAFTDFKRYFAWTALVLAASTSLLGQDAKLKVQADPREAFVFVDGEAYKQHDGLLEIVPGEHMIAVYSYGYSPLVEKVKLNAGENPVITAKLEAVHGESAGPWGNLQVRGTRGDYLVFLNGRKPEFFVGRVSEMKGNRLVLPPGEQHIIIVNPDGNQEASSWYVKIIANRRAIYHADRQSTWYESWPEGAQMHSLPRVQGGTIAVAPVSAQWNASPVRANCGQPVHLVWTASDGFSTMVKQDGVAIANGGAIGDQIVSPKQDTTYYLETFGPGGVTMSPITVHVNQAVTASLTVTPDKLRYHKVGNRIVESGTATIKWSAENAESVHAEGFGPITGTSGEQTISYTPTREGYGPIEQKQTFSITATNTCGGADSSAAQVQYAGLVEAEPEVVAVNLPPSPTEPLPTALPQTSSPLPLIGFLGMGSLVSGLIIRFLAKR